MDFNLTKEQQLLQKSAREFGKEQLEPIAAEIDRNPAFPAETIEFLAELDFMGACFPSEYGGADGDFLSYLLILEELARSCASTAAIVATHSSLASFPIFRWGTDGQKHNYLPDLCTGKKLGGFALAEPDSAPASGAGKVVATKNGEGYLLNGKKYYVVNGGVADVYVVFAVTDPEAGWDGLQAFVVDAATSGVNVGRNIDKMGLRALPVTELVFDNAEASLLGAGHKGPKMLTDILAYAGVASAAIATGICQTALEASVRYSKERVQFGAPIAKLQAIQWMLADMAANVHLMRLATYKAAKLIEENKPFAAEAAMAKMFVAKAGMDVCMNAVQIHGGYGYSREMIIERLFRDVKGTMIFENAGEFPQKIIAETLLR